MKSKLEYIWLDGYKPTQSLRSKTRVESDFSGKLEDCPMWSFDGSSTEQADGSDSDCLLKPVAIIPDPDRATLYNSGVRAIFGPGTSVDEPIRFLEEIENRRKQGLPVGVGEGEGWRWQ